MYNLSVQKGRIRTLRHCRKSILTNVISIQLLNYNILISRCIKKGEAVRSICDPKVYAFDIFLLAETHWVKLGNQFKLTEYVNIQRRSMRSMKIPAAKCCPQLVDRIAVYQRICFRKQQTLRNEWIMVQHLFCFQLQLVLSFHFIHLYFTFCYWKFDKVLHLSALYFKKYQ